MATPEIRSEEKTTVILTVSQDELVVLMKTLGIESLPSFTLPQEFSQVHAEVALRSVLAHFLATMNLDGELEVVPQVTALIQATTMSTRLVTMSVVEGDLTEQHWIYESEDFFVYHTYSPLGVHIFRNLVSAEDLTLTLAQILRLPEKAVAPQPSTEQAQFAKSILDRAREVEPSIGFNMLKQAGVPNAIAEAIIYPDCTCVVTAIAGDVKTDSGDVASDSFVLLKKNNYLFSLRGQNGEINIEPTASNDVIKTVGGYYANS